MLGPKCGDMIVWVIIDRDNMFGEEMVDQPAEHHVSREADREVSFDRRRSCCWHHVKYSQAGIELGDRSWLIYMAC
jgi:hypothetical protein